MKNGDDLNIAYSCCAERVDVKSAHSINQNTKHFKIIARVNDTFDMLQAQLLN